MPLESALDKIGAAGDEAIAAHTLERRALAAAMENASNPYARITEKHQKATPETRNKTSGLTRLVSHALNGLIITAASAAILLHICHTEPDATNAEQPGVKLELH